MSDDHWTEVEPGKDERCTVRCLTCDFGRDSTTLFRGRPSRIRYENRAAAREAADGHMLFHHPTKGRRCGDARCRVDKVITRQARTALT